MADLERLVPKDHDRVGYSTGVENMLGGRNPRARCNRKPFENCHLANTLVPVLRQWRNVQKRLGGVRMKQDGRGVRLDEFKRNVQPPNARLRLKAALIRARCVKACGKFPNASPLSPVSSAYKPTWLA